MRSFAVAAPGSCGELIQGRIDGHDFHVSCPVDLFSRATASLRGGRINLNELPPKTRLAALSAAEWSSGRQKNLFLSTSSELQPGKGMASSTADITAAAAAVALATGRQPSEVWLARLALSIEPTDGIMFSGIVGFDHKKGSILKRLGPAPALKISFVDTGGSVDTIEFNKTKKRYTRSQLKTFRLAYEMILAGFKWRDPRLLGMASTLSALVNQTILPKPALEELIEIAGPVGGYGVVVAHSGSVAGVLHNRPEEDIAAATAHIGVTGSKTVRIVDGGLRVCRS